jgi:hypothetical protein
VCLGQRTQFLRQGESGHEVGDRQEPVLLFCQPVSGSVVLALGAAAVVTGVVSMMDGAT